MNQTEQVFVQDAFRVFFTTLLSMLEDKHPRISQVILTKAESSRETVQSHTC